MLLLLTATASEQEKLREALLAPNSRTFAHRQLHSGSIDSSPVTLLETGIGSVNVAQAVTAYLESATPELVFQIGIGGAYRPSGLAVGDIAVATSEAYGDTGVVTPEGWKPLDEIGIPLTSGDAEVYGVDVYNVIPVDAKVASAAWEALSEEATDSRVEAGPFVTVQQCTGVGAIGDELAGRWNAICENMEGAAAAHVCSLYDVPFLEVRAISNLVEDRDPSKWDIPLACRIAQETARVLISCLSI